MCWRFWRRRTTAAEHAAVAQATDEVHQAADETRFALAKFLDKIRVDEAVEALARDLAGRARKQ